MVVSNSPLRSKVGTFQYLVERLGESGNGSTTVFLGTSLEPESRRQSLHPLPQSHLTLFVVRGELKISFGTFNEFEVDLG